MTRDEALTRLAAGVLSNPNCAGWSAKDVIARVLDIEKEFGNIAETPQITGSGSDLRAETPPNSP